RCVVFAEKRPFVRRESRRQRLGHSGRNAVFDGEHITALRVERLCPDRLLIANIQKLNGDSNAIWRRANGSLQNSIHLQLATNLSSIGAVTCEIADGTGDRKSTRLNSSHDQISYA